MNATTTKAKPEQVAWTMQDGNVMAGTVMTHLMNHLMVRRVDGGIVTVPKTKVRAASGDEILLACKFFSRMGLNRYR